MKARLIALTGLLLINASALARDPVADASRLLQEGKYEAAVERLQPSAPFARDQVEARFLYATALAGAGERDKAIKLLEALIADFPDKPEPYNNLAALHAAKGELDKAKEVLEKALHTNESYGAVYDNLSFIYVEMARASYVKALRVSDASPAPELRLLHALKGAPAVAPKGALAAAPKAAPQVVAAAEPARIAKPEPKAAPRATQPAPLPPPQAAAVPAPAPVAAAPKPAATAADPRQVFIALQKWAQVWSARDVEGYLGFYAPDFNPVGRQSRAQWEAERRERLTGASFINVTLQDPQVKFVSPTEATVTVIQDYKASNYSDRTRKQFRMVKVGESWLIRDERSLGIVP